MVQRVYTNRALCSAALLAVLVFCLLSFWVVYGEPIHDINAWYLEKSFYMQHIEHPQSSVFLEKKKYLGGPSLHGDSRCVYATGEVRVAPISKEEIRRAYADQAVGFWTRSLPLTILFADEYDGPYELPYVTWQDELSHIPASTTPYVIYASAQENILLYDLRCDD